MWLLLCRQHKRGFYPDLWPILLTPLISLITITISLPPPKSTLCSARKSTTLRLWLFFFLNQMCFGYVQKYKDFCKTYYSP